MCMTNITNNRVIIDIVMWFCWWPPEKPWAYQAGSHLPSLINSIPPNIMSKITAHSLHGFSIYFKKVTISNYPQKLWNCKRLYLSPILKGIWSIKIFHSNDRPLFMSVQKLGSSITLLFRACRYGLMCLNMYAQTCMHEDKYLGMHMF